jgi:hypothetical protein
LNAALPSWQVAQAAFSGTGGEPSMFQISPWQVSQPPLCAA